MKRNILRAVVIYLPWILAGALAQKPLLIPEVDGEWWAVAGDPGTVSGCLEGGCGKLLGPRSLSE